MKYQVLVKGRSTVWHEKEFDGRGFKVDSLGHLIIVDNTGQPRHSFPPGEWKNISAIEESKG